MDVWNVATEPSPTGSWFAVIYGDGQWVALGRLGGRRRFARRFDVDRISRAGRNVAFGCLRERAIRGALFLERKSGGTRLDEWAQLDRGHRAGRSMDRLTFGGGRFVAVSSAGQIDTSTNGMQWTSVWHHGNLDFTSVAYGNGHFIATDSALGAVGLSTNGVKWSRLFPARNTVTDWGAVVYGEGEFVALDGCKPWRLCDVRVRLRLDTSLALSRRGDRERNVRLRQLRRRRTVRDVIRELHLVDARYGVDHHRGAD